MLQDLVQVFTCPRVNAITDVRLSLYCLFSWKATRNKEQKMSRLFSPAFNQQFFDENGKPLAAGKLYTYVAGSSTPVMNVQGVSTGSDEHQPDYP